VTLLGLDIGGTKLAAGVATIQGQVLARRRAPAWSARGPDAMITDLLAMARTAVAESGTRPAVVGVSIGGPLDPERGMIIGPPGLPGWNGVPLRDILERALGLPVAIDNDANAAAVAEWCWGHGQGLDNLLYVTVSTGVGGGVIVNSHLLRGVGCGAGEIGHMLVRPNGSVCACGGRGCLEAEASGTAIARKAREALLGYTREASRLWDLCGGQPETVTARHVSQAAREGDLLAASIWEDALDALATGLTNAICTLAPQRVIVGGGVASAGDIFFKPLRQLVAERVHIVPVYAIGIVPSAFGADHAGLMGAFAVALERL